MTKTVTLIMEIDRAIPSLDAEFYATTFVTRTRMLGVMEHSVRQIVNGRLRPLSELPQNGAVSATPANLPKTWL
jgi:hypothetical protein